MIDRAVELGMSLINGLHDLLAPRYTNLRPGQWVWDVRVEPAGLKPGTGEAASLTNRRALLIGTDMAIGKMTAGLEILSRRYASAESKRSSWRRWADRHHDHQGAGVPRSGTPYGSEISPPAQSSVKSCAAKIPS